MPRPIIPMGFGGTVDPRWLPFLQRQGFNPQQIAGLGPGGAAGVSTPLLGPEGLSDVQLAGMGITDAQPGFLNTLMKGPAPLTAATSLGIDALTGRLMDEPLASVGRAGTSAVGAVAGKAAGSAAATALGAGSAILPGIGTAIGGVLGAIGGDALFGDDESKREKEVKKMIEELERKQALQNLLQNMNASANFLNRSNAARARRF